MNPYRYMQMQHFINEEINSGDIKDLKKLQSYLEQELDTYRAIEEDKRKEEKQKAIYEAEAKALDEYRRNILPNVNLLTPTLWTFANSLEWQLGRIIYGIEKNPIISRGNKDEDIFRNAYIFDLVSNTEENIIRGVKNIGPKRLEKLKELLGEQGLSLGTNFTPEEIDILLDSVYEKTAHNIQLAKKNYRPNYR